MQSSTAMMWSNQFSARRDLRVRARTDNNRSAFFNVLDPVTRQSYRIGELERTVLTFLNGRRTLAQVLSSLRKERRYETLDDQQFLLTVEQLQRNGLIRSLQAATKSGLATSGTTSSVARRRRQKALDTARVQSWLSGFVSWQLRGLQPDTWLERLAPLTNAIFSRTAVIFWLSTASVTSMGVLFEFERLATQSSAWQWIVHPVQGSALFSVFLITRALHELGHAIVCKRHGVRCPDIGLFVVLGAPCVYCDVSESSQLPSRWQRASVAAAGMYVELIVATLAAWIWMLTIDGPANTVALQTMFVCSVSTILINANPLMRFDGYYILSDILDETNLRGRADTIADTRLYQWILGRTAGSDQLPRGSYESLLGLFSWMGWVYRAGLSLAIAGLLVAIYDSWNIAWIGRTVAVMILVSWWGIPSVKFAKNLIQMAVKTNRRWRLAIVATALIGLVGLMPVPYRQFGSGWTQPESMRGVYAPATGILEPRTSMPTSGSSVDQGDVLFSIYDVEAIQNVLRAEGDRDRSERELNSQQQSQSKETDSFIVAFENAKSRLREATEELDKRTLKSPAAGRFIAMPASPTTGPRTLAINSLQYDWDSSTQGGRLIPKGTMLGTICGSQMVAVIPLSDSQLEWVFSGTEVRLQSVERVSDVYRCKVEKVVALEDVNAAWRLMNGDLAGDSSSPSRAGPSSPWSGQKKDAAYAAQVVLPSGVEYSVGAKIDGVFIAPSQTLGSLCFRWLKQNLRWLAD